MDIEAAARPDKVERRVFQRAQAVPLMADGVPATDIAKLLGVHLRTVFRWRTGQGEDLRATCAAFEQRAPRLSAVRHV